MTCCIPLSLSRSSSLVFVFLPWALEGFGHIDTSYHNQATDVCGSANVWGNIDHVSNRGESGEL